MAWPDAGLGLSSNKAQDLWTLILFLALIFHGKTDRDGTLGNSFHVASQINLANKSHPLLWVPENALPHNPTQEPHIHWQPKVL